MNWSFGQKEDIHTNIITVVSQLLSHLNIPVTKTSVKETIKQHPDYPSMLCISDALGFWGILNKCYKTGADRLLQLPLPFITNLSTDGGVFITVTNITGNNVNYFDPFKKNRSINRPLDDFLKTWGEVVLIIKSSQVAGEKNYPQKRKNEKLRALLIPLFITSCLSIMLLSAASYGVHKIGSFTSVLFLSLFYLLGSVITSLLLWYEIDSNNPFIQQICKAGNKTNCTAVLESGGSKIFSWLSWSEVGFFYFTGNFLLIAIAASCNQTLIVLNWLNVLVLPYIIYSVIYQWRVVKQWCVLCIAVQALLALIFLYNTILFRDSYSAHNFVLGWSFLSLLFIAYILPVLLWSFTKFYFIRAHEGEKYKAELNRLKYNYQFFETLLTKQKKVSAADGLGIYLGNTNAENTITKVCNPYCDPCAKAHPVVDALLKSNPSLSVQIIFNASSQPGDERREPVRNLLSVYKDNDSSKIYDALDDWYYSNPKDYNKFSGKYFFNAEQLRHVDEDIEHMYNWCIQNSVNFTPTFFINGYQLPEIYSPDDLKYFFSGK